MRSFLLIVLACLAGTGVFSQVNLNQGLIGYFPFNGDALDRSGNNYNPTIVKATLTSDRFGNANNAYHFNGVDDQITIPSSAGLGTSNAMSIALYFNPEQTTVQTLIGKIDFTQGNGTQFQIAIDWSAYPGVLYGVNDPQDNCALQIVRNSSYVKTGGGNVPTNQWYCLAATYDHGVQKIYLNGSLIDSRTSSFPTLKQCNSDIQIGTWWQGDQQRYKGKIDDVRIYNRALTDAEITALCITCSAPASDFNFQQDVCNPLTVQFSGTGTNLLDPTWDFGDGTLYAGSLNPVHNYANPGNYTVKYSVQNGNCKDVITKPVSVNTTTGTPCSATAQFTTPDTVCLNTPVTITNTSINATSYYWNFCVADINTPPVAVNIGNPGNLSAPVFMDYVYTNNNYYAFVTNYTTGNLVRLNFGSSLLNTPTSVNLGNYGGILQAGTAIEGIQIVQNEGNWYAIIVGGNTLAGTQPRIVKIDFGASITNPGAATNWGNIGNMEQPVDLHIFKEGNNWYGLTINAENNTIVRFNFTSSFNNTPTAVNLGNIGSLLYPTGIYAINDNGFWRVFITNAGDNRRIGTNSSISRLDFGSSLLNTPTGVNLGNPGGQLHHPRDFTIMKFCGQIIGFAVNGNPAYNDLVRLNFNNDLTAAPTITSLGNLGNLDFPHSISKLFRANDEVYAFITNVANNTITRLRFAGCTNASVSSSTLQNPQPVTYSIPGTYNINLTIDDGLPTQASYCKQVVVLPPPVHTPTKAITICTGEDIKIGTGVKQAKYTWNTGAASDSILVNTGGFYWVQSEMYGCTNRDTMIVTAQPDPLVDLGPDASFCTITNQVLDAGNASAGYVWQDGSTAQTFNATAFGKYYVKVTNSYGCSSSDTIRIIKTLVIPADFYFKQDACNPLSVQFFGKGNNPLNPYWAFGDGNTVTGNLTPTYIYPTTGNYTVRFGVESGNCIDTITKIITLDVTRGDLILTNDTTICINTTKQLQTRQAPNFCWWPTTGLDNPNAPNPITSTLQNITYFFTAPLTSGNNLVVNGDFSSGNTGFTSSYNYTSSARTGDGEYGVNTTPVNWDPALAHCIDHTTGTGNMLLVHGSSQNYIPVWSQTVTVTPNTNYSFSTWLQYFSATTAARLQFAVNGIALDDIYLTNIASCNWRQFNTIWNSGNNTSVTLSIVNQNTAPAGKDFALDDITFAPVFMQRDSVIISVETPMVKANNDTTICKDAQVPLQATGAATWDWSPVTGLSNATISNPVATPTANTDYIVTGKTINGCFAKDTVVITFFPIPTVISDHNVLACPNTAVQLAANSSLASYAWSPAATLNNPAIANPIATPTQNTRYLVQGKDANNCNYADSVNVQFRTFQFSASGVNGAICQGETITLQATGGDTYLWSPAGSLDNALIATPQAQPDTSTLYNVYITENNCNHDTTIQVLVNVNPSPTVIAEKTNDLDCMVHSARLNATGTPGNAYRWWPTSGLDQPAMPNPVSTTDSTITYIVTGTNKYGCTAADSVTVYVNATGKVSFEVPNAFTPNSDGRNDCLGVKSWGGVEIEEFSIFNRWGQRMFTTNKTGICWDGRYRGEIMPSGAYVYVIKAKTYCGHIKRTGTVMLIK